MKNTLQNLILITICFAVICFGQEDGDETVAQQAKAFAEKGMTFLQAGNMEDARENFQKALDLQPNDLTSKYMLASIYVFENYEKREYQVAMRDGVKLHTQVYTPKDNSEEYPVIYCRSPYSSFAYGTDFSGYFGFLGPGPEFIKERYIFVIQDVRGKFMSEGEFEVMRPNTADWNDPSQTDESTDAYDSIEWMNKKLTSFNGRVGIWGGSYLAYYGALALVNAHPSLKAVSLESPVGHVFKGDDYHHNGALHLAYTATWMNRNDKKRIGLPTQENPARIFESNGQDLYKFYLELGPLKNLEEKLFTGQSKFWTEAMSHESYDEFWSSRTLGPNLKGIKGPAVVVAGTWFDDQDLYGTLHTYKALKEQNPELPLWFFMGCWDHDPWWMQETGRWGQADLPAGETGDHFRDKYLVSFFGYFLKDKGEFNQAKVQLFESGSNKMVSLDQWPNQDTSREKLFLGSGGKLLKSTQGKIGFDEFISDPANPVPFYAGEQDHWTPDFMHADQRFVSGREDVLSYQSDLIKEDVTMAGPIEVDLFVSTSGSDADWVVKVIDQYPDEENGKAGYQMLVRGDILRGKFRNSLVNPEPMEPGKITRIRFELPDVNHTFKKGHRIVIQVQSSWFPIFDINPQVFTNIREAGAEQFKKATHKIYFSPEYPSAILFEKPIF